MRQIIPLSNSGSLTITPASLSVKADDKTISLFCPLPTFTSTITGFKNNDSNTIISGPYYKISPNFCSWIPGVFTITPYGLQLASPNNYSIAYVPGTLSVVWWYCPPHSKQNSRISIYNEPLVSLKTDNISNTFKGMNQLTEGHKNFSYQNSNNGFMIVRLTKEINEKEMQDNTSAYPNPTNGNVTIKVSNASLQNGIIITDVLGRTYSSNAVKKIYSNQVKLDLSNFRSGVYFIKVRVGDTFKIFRVIKQ